MKLSTQIFIEKSTLVHGNKYSYDKVVYKNSRTKVVITCPVHGDFEQTASSHMRGLGCLECKRENQKTTTNGFIAKSKIIHGEMYGYDKVEYTGNKNKVVIYCKTHGDFEQRPDAHLQGQGCFKCESDNRRLGGDKFITKSISIHRKRYNYNKVVYVNLKTKVVITCLIHGDFKQTPYSHLSGSGCPNCNQSRGEQLLYNILTERNISFESQFRFGDCRGKRHPLPFDFVVFDKKCDISFLIEYDGEQHFNKMRYDVNNDRLMSTQHRDKIKTEYCRTNNIPL